MVDGGEDAIAFRCWTAFEVCETIAFVTLQFRLHGVLVDSSSFPLLFFFEASARKGMHIQLAQFGIAKRTGDKAQQSQKAPEGEGRPALVGP